MDIEVLPDHPITEAEVVFPAEGKMVKDRCIATYERFTAAPQKYKNYLKACRYGKKAATGETDEQENRK
jgi:hypothetical protein